MLNLIDVQHEILLPNREYLPSINFFDDLQEFVSRTPQQHSPPKPAPTKLQPLQTYYDEIDESVSDKLKVSLKYWSEHIRQGSTSFYGLAMLSISYEKTGQHKRALFFIKKARKIEPRVTLFEWMRDNYNWTDEHKQLLDKLISDDDFWSPTIS